jgi:uncharacterized membrane protein YphA (DoxX/SURF4 family)
MLQLSGAEIRGVATLCVRWIVGTLFIFQAYDRIFKVGLHAVAETFCAACGNGHLLRKFSHPFVVVNAWVELIAGVLLLAGFMVGIVSSALCINLVMVTMVFSWAKPIWDESHLIVRLSLLLFLMLIPSSWDIASIDHLLN